jgi:hypothetical protein
VLTNPHKTATKAQKRPQPIAAFSASFSEIGSSSIIPGILTEGFAICGYLARLRCLLLFYIWAHARVFNASITLFNKN